MKEEIGSLFPSSFVGELFVPYEHQRLLPLKNSFQKLALQKHRFYSLQKGEVKKSSLMQEDVFSIQE